MSALSQFVKSRLDYLDLKSNLGDVHGVEELRSKSSAAMVKCIQAVSSVSCENAATSKIDSCLGRALLRLYQCEFLHQQAKIYERDNHLDMRHIYAMGQ